MRGKTLPELVKKLGFAEGLAYAELQREKKRKARVRLLCISVWCVRLIVVIVYRYFGG